ncbi:ABC transporter permease [Dactylosporangium aurantiacum]|uniref:ABC transporter permease n=1 Tax=Dactylosporangium aurantiacum TaxID=35754 RepID=A0A9Q9MKP3_9ACTN|nr:FtsX-like permease family protein [Dactylosporangium aurantiacum]MDG6106023.1 ABC transporter permease [Dactylosporangium aurantiacum]UWZ55931.1 ABC transporter permease [Dactylosporangium aurantiacum]
MTAWTVMLRGIRYRAGRSFVVFLLAVTATTAAVLAPAYSRAAQQSVLTDGLSAASTDATGLTVGAKGTADSAAFKDLAEIRLAMNTALTKDQLLADRLDLPVAAIDTEVTFGDVGAKLAYRDNACYHLTIDGDCPDNPGEVAVSKRTATARDLKVGDRLTVRMGPATGGHDRTFTIRGLYTPTDGDAAYWGRTSYFSAAAGGDGERADALFSMTEDDLRLERMATLATRLEYPLRADRVRLDDVAGLRDGIQTLGDRLRGQELEVTTTLPAVLRDIDTDRASIGRTAPVIAVPLLLLCWFVLFLLVASLTDERAPEIALAKLRGYPAGRATRFGLGEVLLLIVAAVPVGIAAGLLLVQAAAGALLAGGVRVEVRWPVFAAAGVALAAGLAAAVLAGRQTLARPVLGLLRRVPERGGWRAGAAEGVVVALAVASLAAAVNDRGSPLALLAPPLLAVVVGVAAARLLGLWSNARLRIARRRGRIVPLLSAAQLSRRPGGQRLVVVVTVAVALLTFAATAWDAAAQARRDVADDTVGAQRVLTVAADHPSALEAAVDRADPGGHAMAVVRASQRFDNAPVELVGVQSGRLADVAVWRGRSRADVGELAARLHPDVAAPLRVGRDLAADITVDALPARPALRVAAIVAAPGQPPRTVTLGGLSKGAKSYHATLNGCANGCRLVGLAVGRAAGGSEPFAVSVTVRGLQSDGGPLAPGFDLAGRWQPRHSGGGAQVTVRPGAALGVDVSGSDPADAVVEHVDTPAALPAVLAGGAPADDAAAATFRLPGFSDQPQPFTVAAHAASLPRAGRRGVLFDLDYATRMAERGASLADNATLRYEVWASAAAPADLDRRLAAAGVQVLRTETIDGQLSQLARRAPALGLWLYLLAGGAAILLAIGVVLLTAYVGVRARLYELAALRVAGVRAGQLRRAVFREYRALLGLPLVVGLGAGLVGAMVMLPGIPLVTVGVAAPVTVRPGAGALPVAAGVIVIGLSAAVLMVLRLMGRATPERLRDGAQ